MSEIKDGTKMHSDTTVYTYDERGMIWHGVCKECKGEKAKYTPEQLKAQKIKPCETCTDMKRYELARP
jgi:hypothetical protein